MGGYGVRLASASAGGPYSRTDTVTITDKARAYWALAAAGYRRFATYRTAMFASMFTNTVFGFLRAAVLLAVSKHGTAAGYTGPQMSLYVWAGQGLIGTVLLWQPPDLIGRIRTGEVVTDLLRPVDFVWRSLATDLGAAAQGALTRFVGPTLVGLIFFDLYRPRHLTTYPFFVISVVLATVICFGCRYLVASLTYWLLDARGPWMFWTFASSLASGLAFPIWFLPHDAAMGVYVFTPVPSVIQVPLDVVVERGPVGWLLGLQAFWAVALLALCKLVQHRAQRRLVLQGG
jgi:ABC-2 type transport system permease protein